MSKLIMTIGKLLKQEDESVFVLNNSLAINKRRRPDNPRMSNISFDVSFGNGQVRNVIVYDTWVPQDVTEQAPKSDILASPTFRDAVTQGWIKLVSNPEAEQLLEDEDAQVELQRVRNKHHAVASEVGKIEAEILPMALATEKDAENADINMVFMDMCERDDVEPIEVYSKLRSMKDAISLKEAYYVNKNLKSECRDKKVNKYLEEIIANLQK